MEQKGTPGEGPRPTSGRCFGVSVFRWDVGRVPSPGVGLELVQKQMRSSGFRPASVERKSVERRSAFEVTTLYAQTLYALGVLAGHNVRITPKVWKLFLHEHLALSSPSPHNELTERRGRFDAATVAKSNDAIRRAFDLARTQFRSPVGWPRRIILHSSFFILHSAFPFVPLSSRRRLPSKR